MIEITNPSSSSIKACLVLCDNPSVRMALPVLKANSTNKRILYFKNSIKSLDFLCLDNSDATVLELRFVKVSRKFACARMNRKLGGHFPRSQIKSIFDKYNLKFSMGTLADYRGWIEYVEPFMWVMKDSSKNIPTISIVIPVYNPDLRYLKRAINSVLNQTSLDWELVVVDDCSTDPEVVKYLEELVRSCQKIKMVRREVNGHISEATNSGLMIADSEYVAFMDQDDLLSPNAVAEIQNALLNNPEALLIYSDEDKVDENDVRYSPHFKPDYSPETLLSQNYISHLTVLKLSLIKKVGCLRQGYEGAQDYDLLLRVSCFLDPQNVIHIPKILYHWRAHPGSTALSGSEKSYTWNAGLKSLKDYCKISEIPFKAEFGVSPNTYRLEYHGCLPKVSIIIPTKNRVDLLRVCIDSLLEKTIYPDFEVVVVDNGSDCTETLIYFDAIKSIEGVKIVEAPIDFNFSRLNNMAVEVATGEVICLLNNDIEIIEADWLNEMVGLALKPGIGCVGAKLLYPDNTLQHGGVILGIGGVAGHSCSGAGRFDSGYFDRLLITNNVSAVTAACLVVQKEIYTSVGGLDEGLPVAFNDIDFCIRVRDSGYRNVWTPYACLYHHESASRGYEITPEKKARFRKEIEYMRSKWGTSLDSDPYYNPNFDLSKSSYEIIDHVL
ncbi:glycosyltransferase family 2 protein [Oceanobacter mangrovi]|uniref:glycosyltransferase family 2 protein n=1 Tax=Oceanobacter mangrovi TaxID=2862510 RepID=UPI001C8E33B7|nr:glycosyltransferase family 2 protein [Oceanobacter mangrovi]